MIQGSVSPFREAVISITVVGPLGSVHIPVVVDTGYTGSLTLEPDQIAALGLPFQGQGRAELGDGRDVLFDTYEGEVVWHNMSVRIWIDEADTEPLLGMELLHGSELRIQVVDGGSVTIQPLGNP